MSGNDLPPTERENPRTRELDTLETAQLVAVLVDEQRGAAEAVRRVCGEIARIVDTIAERLRRGGRLHYVGAGTSGRLATLDAAEMPPTFGTPPDLVIAHVAGGTPALTRAVEGAEDDGDAGAAAIAGATAADAVIGVSASGGAEFVVRAIEHARANGAFTVAITGVADSELARAAETRIVLDTGPEAIAGSTRLVAGTAQKIALNAISTAVMVRLSKVHGHLMVDVIATNRKLRARAIRLVCAIAGVGARRAEELLDAAGGHVKVAVVMERRNVDAVRARAMLDDCGGVLRSLL